MFLGRLIGNKKINAVKLFLYATLGIYLVVIITNLLSYDTISRINESELKNKTEKEPLTLKLKGGTIKQTIDCRLNDYKKNACLNLWIATHNKNDVYVEIEVVIGSEGKYSFKGNVNDNDVVRLKPHKVRYNHENNYIKISSNDINMISIWCIKNRPSNYLIKLDEREYNICLTRDYELNKRYKNYCKISHIWDLSKEEFIIILIIILSLKVFSFLKLLKGNTKYIILFIASFMITNSLMIPPLLNSDEYQHYLGFFKLDKDNNVKDFEKFISKVHWNRISSSYNQKLTSFDVVNSSMDNEINTEIETTMINRSIIAGNIFKLISGIISNMLIPYQILILRIFCGLFVLICLSLVLNWHNKLFIILCFSIPYLSILSSSISNYFVGITLFLCVVLSIRKTTNSLKLYFIVTLISLLFHETQSMIMIVPSLIVLILTKLNESKKQKLCTIKIILYLLFNNSLIYFFHPNIFHQNFSSINLSLNLFLISNVMFVILLKITIFLNDKFPYSRTSIKFHTILFFVFLSIISSYYFDFPCIKDVQLVIKTNFYDYFLSIISTFSSWFRINYPDYLVQRSLFLGHPIEQISLIHIAESNSRHHTVTGSWSLLIMYLIFIGTIICKYSCKNTKYLPTHFLVLFFSVFALYIVQFINHQNMNGRYLLIYFLYLLYIFNFLSIKVEFSSLFRNYFAYIFQNKYYIILIIFIINNSISLTFIFKRFY